MTTITATTTQVYQLFIKATPEQVWDAITKPELTTKYFFAARIELAEGRRRAWGPNGEIWGDSAILEEDRPHRLVHNGRASTTRSRLPRRRAVSPGRSSRRRGASRS
jgi:uncharacterized protein YndB with AHSA1/START domain